MRDKDLKRTLMIVAIVFFSIMIFKEIVYEIRIQQAISAFTKDLEKMNKSFAESGKKAEAQRKERERQEAIKKAKIEKEKKDIAEKKAAEQRAIEKEKIRQMNIERFARQKEHEFERTYKDREDCASRFVECANERKRAKDKFFEEQGIKHIYDEAKQIQNRKHGVYINSAN